MLAPSLSLWVFCAERSNSPSSVCEYSVSACNIFHRSPVFCYAEVMTQFPFFFYLKCSLRMTLMSRRSGDVFVELTAPDYPQVLYRGETKLEKNKTVNMHANTYLSDIYAHTHTESHNTFFQQKTRPSLAEFSHAFSCSLCRYLWKYKISR